MEDISLLTGATESFGNGDSDVYLIKTDGNGIEQWSQTFGGILNYDVMVGPFNKPTDGGFIMQQEIQIFWKWR